MKRKVVEGDAFTQEGLWVESKEPGRTSFYAVVYSLAMDYKGCQRGVYLTISYLKQREEYHVDGYAEASLAPSKGTQYNISKRSKTFAEARQIGIGYVRLARAFVEKALRNEIARLTADLNKVV